MESLRDQQQEAHRRLRQDFTAAIESLQREYRELRQKYEDMKDDVLTIKVEREMEERQIMRRGAALGAAVSAGLTVLIKVAEWLLTKR